ncbi:hypothetical protein N5918_11095 [Glaesserella parasuis]|uniref:hypothetical protein n=1 Tax=Glaesserella parasuis TaxID=738 RepID=UPI0024369730|nr:hypothetical protein [Glaesserella parasuis]MDD2173600.1 hypothetical protein [Glaesserella parasuis]MDG6449308.1 hypothetical protein [Glaesserella parasuis]MDP0273905.1 hypothetical protein [Glaesserella parasuis]MDP0307887.1 hypothetical protein [Glaesserella parasuis]MDP0472669.1 hypothetical protein [Glaesserella parasuis]
MIKFLQILAVNLPLVGSQNIYSEAAQLEAKQHLALLAENDVVLGSATTSSALTELLRIQRQNIMKGTEKNWGAKNPNGSLFDPKVIQSK